MGVTGSVIESLPESAPASSRVGSVKSESGEIWRGEEGEENGLPELELLLLHAGWTLDGCKYRAGRDCEVSPFDEAMSRAETVVLVIFL